MKFFEKFPPSSRVWIYQSNRPFTANEVIQINNITSEFTSTWKAHDEQLTAAAEVLYNRFIVFCVNEENAGASGCSIDKSVHVIRSIEKEFNLFLLNRMLVAWLEEDVVVSGPLNYFVEFYKEGKVNMDTIVFNNTVSTQDGLNNDWKIAVKSSWIASHLPETVTGN